MCTLYSLQNLCLFSAALTLGLTFSSYAQEEETQVYIVYMGGLPQGEKYTLSSSYHEDMLRQVVHNRKSLVRSYTRSFNGFAANLTLKERDNLASFEEVVSIFPSVTLKTQTTRSWDFMGFPEAVPRNHRIESDIIVGVIDSGVWPESPSFSDDGGFFGPPPKKWKGECKGGKNFTCNNKLIGARYYELSDSARDTFGHGTHTSSTAAGRIVGPVGFYGLGEGASRGGVPSARIAAYRVCTPFCLTYDILSAFDDAIADGVDVISISISYSEPSDPTEDSISIGAFHAIGKGVLTVHSAGNNGPKPGGISSVVPWVFTVGAGEIDRRFVDRVSLGNGRVITGGAIDTFERPRNRVSFPLVYGKDASSNCSELKSQQCEEGCLNISLVHNKIVVCDLLVDSTEAYQAGAAGMIKKNVLYSPPSVVPFPESWLKPSDFARLLGYINSTKHLGRTPEAYISATESITDHRAPRVARYSARGPNTIIPDILKPDVIAPGTDILAAYPPHLPLSLLVDKRSNNFTIMSGTSMACPHIAGAAAYVKSFHPDWSPSAIKSALMTTAGRLKDSHTADAEFAYGAGHMDPVKAAHPGLVYDISTSGYIQHLCHLGYNTSAVRKITGDHISMCPRDKTKHDDQQLNYPTMVAKVQSKVFKAKFFRTVTNVGRAESRYRVKIVKTISGGRVIVRPRVLRFRALHQRLSFVVRVSGKIRERMAVASIVWSDGRHEVRSPIVVYDDSAVL